MTDNLVEIPIADQNTTSQPTASIPQAKPTTSPPPVPVIPSTEQMEQNLQQSGKLLPELRVQKEDKMDTSPLAALQPDNMVQTNDGPQPLNLPSQKETPLAQTELATTHVPSTPTATAELWWNQIHKPVKTLVAVALAGQGLFGIYKSLIFILVTYPQLEAQLTTHMITQAEVNGYATHAIIIVFTTFISMFFALRIIRNKATTWINTLLGVGLFLGGTYITSFLSSNFDLITLLTLPFYSFTSFLRGTSNSVTNNLPEVVWYQ